MEFTVRAGVMENSLVRAGTSVPLSFGRSTSDFDSASAEILQVQLMVSCGCMFMS